MLDKLRKEVAELSIMINNDKFKCVRTIEVIKKLIIFIYLFYK